LQKDIDDRRTSLERALAIMEQVDKKDAMLALIQEEMVRMTEQLREKDDQIEGLKEALVREVPEEEARNTRLQKKK